MIDGTIKTSHFRVSFPIAYSWSPYNGSSFYVGTGSNVLLWVNWPTSVPENATATVLLSTAFANDISSSSTVWTDANGNVISGDGDYLTAWINAAGQTQLTAAITVDFESGGSLQLPPVNIAVVPAAPTALTATAFSSTEIDLAWTDNSSIATQDIIYESTDDGASFYPIDQVTTAGVGATNTYAATGLTSNTEYQFYITSAADYAESEPSGLYIQDTTFVPPTLDVEGTGTVVEGQPYELDLTANYPDGEPGAVTQFSVDWNDGPGGTSNIINYPAGDDPTVPLVVTHTFAQGIATPTITVTATDGINATFGPVTQSVAVIPMTPPPLNYTVASGNEIDLMWGMPSYISTGTILFESTDGVNFNPIYEVAAGVTNYAVTGLNPDTQYWFQAETDSVNGQSAPSTIGPVLTGEYVEPQLVVDAQGPASENQPLSLSLAWNAPQDGLASGAIISWIVTWDDGDAPQSYQALASGSVLSVSNTYSGSTASTMVTVDAIDASNRTFIALSQVFAFAPAAPTNVTANYENDGTSVSFNWDDDSEIAADYLLQRELLGSSWTNIDTVPAGTGPDYAATDTGLTAGVNGSGGGYLYRVIAQGPQLADSNSPAESDPDGAFAPYQSVLSSGTRIIVGNSGASPGTSDTGVSTTSGTEVTAGGVAEVPVDVSDAQGVGLSGVNLTVIGYDPAITAPFETTVTTNVNGLAYIPIQGIGTGSSPIVITDSGGDEGSGNVNVTTPSTTGDSQYEVSLPGTPITSPNGGTDDIQSNLAAATSVVNADSHQDAFLTGITGYLTNSTTGQTVQWPNPSHIYVYPPVGNSPPLVIYDPSQLPIDDTTDLPDPPPPTTIYYDIPITFTTVSFSLTAQHANQGMGYKNKTPKVTAAPAQPQDLYVGEQPAIDQQKNGAAKPGGTAIVNISSLNGATWTIQPTSKNGKSEVSDPAGGTFNGGPVKLTLTPSPDLSNSDPGDLTYTVTATLGQTTATITIHILKIDASTETINLNSNALVPGSGNEYGPDLDPTIQQTAGAYIPFDDLDENYDGTADYIDTKGGHAVVGDTLMVQIQLQDVEGPTPGSYFLDIPSNPGFAVYKNDNGTSPVTDTTPLSGDGYVNLYVQGISKSYSGMLWVDWSATGSSSAITVVHADGIHITTFAWTGSQDVPGNTTYTYIASGLSNADGWEQATNSTSFGGVNTSKAAITWNDGPAFGEAIYKVNENYSWEFTVNVVQVDLNPNAPNTVTLTPNAPAYSVNEGQPLTILSVPPNAGPAMKATVGLDAIIGPQVNRVGVMRGARWIEVGFLQTVKFVSVSGIYSPIAGGANVPDTATVWADGNTHIDGADGLAAANNYPWLDPTNSKGLEYMSFTTNWQNQKPVLNDNGSKAQTLSTNDSPHIQLGEILNPAVLHASYNLVSTKIHLDFELNVAVATTKPDDPQSKQKAGTGSATDNLFTPLGQASWFFDGTGTVNAATWAATTGTAGTGETTTGNPPVVHTTALNLVQPIVKIVIPPKDNNTYANQRGPDWQWNK